MKITCFNSVYAIQRISQCCKTDTESHIASPLHAKKNRLQESNQPQVHFTILSKGN